MPELNYPRAAHVAVRVENCVCVIGGWGEGNIDLSSVEMLDVTRWMEMNGDELEAGLLDSNEKSQWVSLVDSPMPTARCNAGAVVVGHEIYVVGGWGGGSLI